MKKYATNDMLIEEFLLDSRFKTDPDGIIWTSLPERGYPKIGPWRQKKVKVKKGGYSYVTYKGKDISVHRIIYRAHLNNPPLNDQLTINHKDGEPLNNNVSNLELISISENNTHRFRGPKKNKPVAGFKKINREIAECIRKDRLDGLRYDKLCEKYSLCKSTISYIINNKTWYKDVV